MSIASIDIPAMRDLVSALVVARGSIAGHREAIARQVLDVDLTAPRLLSLMGVEAWIDAELPGVRRRLAAAEAIDAQTPGLSRAVSVDESLLSTATPEQARADARRAAQLIAEHGIRPDVSEEVLDRHGIPPELLDLLSRNALDPYFAHELAQHTSPEDVVDLVTAASAFRRTVASSQGVVVSIEDYDAQYESLLSGLGESLGLATRGTDDLRLPNDWRHGWVDAMADLTPDPASYGTSPALALSLVMSRGTWSTPIVYEAANALHGAEKVAGPGVWAEVSGSTGLVAPGGDTYADPLAGVLAAVAADPVAAQWLFDDSTVPTVTVEGQEVVLDGFLEHCLRRQWPSDDGAAFMAALSAATTPVEGGSTVSADISTRARELVAQITAEYEEQQRQAEAADRGWLSDWGHAVLDVLGLIPVLGEPADGVNTLWYTAEGNYVDAGLSAAGMIPVVGWASVGGKWVRRVLSPDELAALERQLDGVPVNASTAPGPTGPPVGGVFRREKPEWLKRFEEGKAFEAPVLDDVVARGGATQVRVLQPARGPNGRILRDENGQIVYREGYPYNVVDGYLDGDEIIEVKDTQFASVTEAHAFAELRTLSDKYAPGTRIADVPSAPAGLAGQPLRGQPVLVVPPQTAGIPPRVLERAQQLGIVIRSSDGEVYTP